MTATTPVNPETIHGATVQNNSQVSVDNGVVAKGTPAVNVVDTLAVKAGYTVQSDSANVQG